ncbi:hypothetical protein KFE25_006113 [Diacronema lutheri]|uniref:Uncharacterized protein n=1 Tax=Diacronema lutheri TaxID=2081491 RepID=A0A8J6CJ88_DIALT|nr:hypothetical protein KFE25_006113 [Diacronema lutheri]
MLSGPLALVCLVLAPHATVRPGGFGRLRTRALAPHGAGGFEPANTSPDDDDISVLERESVRYTASAGSFGASRDGRTQVYGAWLDDDIVGERGEKVQDKLSLGVKLMRSGKYAEAVVAFEDAVRDAGGEWTMRGGQTCVWLAQALYANSNPEAAIEMLSRLERGHPGSNVRKAALEIKYILEAPQLKLDKSNFVQIPDAVAECEKVGRHKPVYKQMKPEPKRWTLEWILQEQAKPKKPPSEPDPAGSAVAVLLAAAVSYVVVSLTVPL